MQHLRHRIGSAGMGGNGQFTRLTVLNKIADENGTPWHGALLEDFEIGLHVLLSGWGNRYCNDTWVAQEGLPNARLLVRQRTRWAQGGMQCAKYFKRVLLSPHISTPSAIEIAYFLFIPWTQLIGTVVYVTAFSIMGYWALSHPDGVSEWFLGGAWGILPLIVVFGLGPLVAWGLVYRLRCEPQLSRRAAIGLGLCYWGYSYLMITAVWAGFFRVLTARRGWAKTNRVLDQSNAAPRDGGLETSEVTRPSVH
jgi:1,2-diacylglycerol 3-beta-glucosyltransferase